ncbi:hypothetical protein [Sinomicrobium sp. M5D2P9]
MKYHFWKLLREERNILTCHGGAVGCEVRDIRIAYKTSESG